MKGAIEKLLGSVRPHFYGEGKLKWAWPLHEGLETFLLTSSEKTHQDSHVRDPMDMKRLMIFVVFAILPAMIAGMWNIGHQGFLGEGNTADAASIVQCFLRGAWHMLPIVIVSYTAGGIWELLFCIVRKHEINEGFLVTGLLFPLTLPPTIPLWMVAVGVSFGVVIGKEVFGGTGFNVLNPALTARAFAFFAFPAAMSGTGSVWNVAGKWNPFTAYAEPIQGFTGATPLLAISAAGRGGDPLAALAAEHWTWTDAFLGNIPGSMAESSALAILIGAGMLIVTGIGSWRIMVSCVLGLVVTTGILSQVAGPESMAIMHLPPHYHLVVGGFMFGAVYMATDPVSAAQTQVGRWIYGFGIGAMVGLIRVFNPAYTEAVMMAILFMNVFAPLIDYVVIQRSTRRRVARLAAQGG